MNGESENTCREACREYGDFEVYEPIHNDDEIIGYRGDYVMDWYYAFMDNISEPSPSDPNEAPSV